MSDDAVFREDFSRWYRPLNLAGDPATQDRRRTAVGALVEQAKWADVESLVRVAFASKQAAPAEVVARLRKVLNEADDTLATQGGDREFQILCAAGLSELFRRSGRVAAGAALAVSTTSLGGARRVELPQDLSIAAETGIAIQSEAVRRRPELDTLAPPRFPKAEFDKAAAKLQAQQDFPTAIAAFGAMTDAASIEFAAMSGWFRSGVQAANAYMLTLDEELRMLWWLVGERSWDLDRPFAKVKKEERAIVLAKELADLTKYLPGPVALRALLGRGGLKDQDELTIAACVNACDTGWLMKLVEGFDPSPVTRPIHLAIKRKLETGDDKKWIAGWEAATDLDSTKKLSALLVGQLFYRERLQSNLA